MRITLLFLSFLFFFNISSGQMPETLTYPKEGSPMPDFTIRNIKYYIKNEARSDDFKGKWLLLDFWNKYCTACFSSFPHTNQIQKELGQKIQVMLVGIQDKEGEIQSLYARYKMRLNLDMPCAFDSLLSMRFDIYASPIYILIDDKGIVRCITSSINLDDVRHYLAGDIPRLPKVKLGVHKEDDTHKKHYSFDPEKPFLTYGNGGNDSDFLYRSIISLFNDKQDLYIPLDPYQDVDKGRFQILGVPLKWLFNLAYFGAANWNFLDSLRYGKVYKEPILHIHDSSKFEHSYKYVKNLYSYSLSLPKSICTRKSIRAVLRKDLSVGLGISAKVEIRKCPYWKLVMIREDLVDRLKSVGGEYYFNESVHTGFSAHNCPFDKMVKWIMANCPEKIIVDESNMLGNVDIVLDCITTNFEDLKKALIINGLDLVLSEKYMKVLVIKEQMDE